MFRKKKGRSNLTTFQEQLLKSLQADNNIVFALSDKGLGPVAVTLDRYIQDGLKHLQDSTTYEIISEEQALAEIDTLRDNI